jgi:hypothetical protein
MYGVDAQKTQAFGNSPPGAPNNWDNSWDHGIYGFALPQAYLDYATGGQWSFRGGYFYAPFGTESFMAVDNFFYSHSFARIRSRPNTMSGLLAEYDMGNGVSVVNGVTAGWDSAFENIGNAASYVGGIIIQRNENMYFSGMVTAGESGIFGSATGMTTAMTAQLSDNFIYNLQTDYYSTDAYNDYGATNQFLFKVNGSVGLGTRLEYYNTDRLRGTPRSTWGWTTGINFRPHSNFIVRPEYRIDWGPAAASSGKSYFGIDMIIMY